MDIRVAVAAVATLAGTWLAGAAPSHAHPTDPPPDCGFTSAVPWSPCAESPPWQSYPNGAWDFDPKPGQWGPGGYRPCVERGGCNS